jgi:hypothetical protein
MPIIRSRRYIKVRACQRSAVQSQPPAANFARQTHGIRDRGTREATLRTSLRPMSPCPSSGIRHFTAASRSGAARCGCGRRGRTCRNASLCRQDRPEVSRCDCSCSLQPSSVPCVFRGAIYYRVEGGRNDPGFELLWGAVDIGVHSVASLFFVPC